MFVSKYIYNMYCVILCISICIQFHVYWEGNMNVCVRDVNMFKILIDFWLSLWALHHCRCCSTRLSGCRIDYILCKSFGPTCSDEIHLNTWQFQCNFWRSCSLFWRGSPFSRMFFQDNGQFCVFVTFFGDGWVARWPRRPEIQKRPRGYF